MRRKLIVLFALLSLAASGACGDDADTDAADPGDSAGEPLTKAEFIEQGDAICGQLGVATGEIETPADQDDFARYLREIQAAAETARDDWADLEPPTDGEEVHEAMLTQLDNAIESVEGAVTAAESGDTVTAEDLLTQADSAGDAIDAEAQAYGFEECGRENAEGEGETNTSSP